MKARTISLLTSFAAAGCVTNGHSVNEGPPGSERLAVTDTHHGLQVTEDYRWLEDWNDPKVQALLAGLSPEAAARLRAAAEENWDDARIAASLAPAAAWALNHNKPIIVDEFGVLGRYASLADRARWLRAVRTEAERYCFGWTHWEFDEAFGLLDDAGQTVEPALAKALLGK